MSARVNLREVIESARQQGHLTLRQQAEYLNDLGISSAAGK
jgi:hypothetical protein